MNFNLVNEQYIEYTYRHRIAVKYITEKLLDDCTFKDLMLTRAFAHDMDKQFLYLLGVPKELASKYHRETSQHHMENDINKCVYDFYEAVFDFESAGYTKEDKPLNAYDTILMKSGNNQALLLDICSKIGIDSSYKNTPFDYNWRQYMKKYEPVILQAVIEDVIQWSSINPKYAQKLVQVAKELRGE